MAPREKFDNKLLVEGNDDQHVVWALCEKYKIPENFDVVDCRGISNLFSQIPVRLKQANLKSLGIIIDADIDLNAQWSKLTAILQPLGFTCPTTLPPTGLIVQNQDIKIGIWIMPNNDVNGMLEDFISFLIPEQDSLSPIVGDTLNIIEAKGVNKYRPNHKAKAHIHSWLSWQEDPGTPMGLAITKKYLNTEHGNCRVFIDWILKTFS